MGNKFVKSFGSLSEFDNFYKGDSGFSKEEAIKIADKLGINLDKIPLSELLSGLKEELEHRDITDGDPIMTGKIAYAHLKEDPHYYSKLKAAMDANKS
jgi:hypothetical protein